MMEYSQNLPGHGQNRQIRLLRRTVIDMSYLPKDGTETRVLVSRIPVLGASDDAGSSLLVRVHNVRIATSGTTPGKLVVDLIDDAWTPEDGNRTFLGDTITGATVTLDPDQAIRRSTAA